MPVELTSIELSNAMTVWETVLTESQGRIDRTMKDAIARDKHRKWVVRFKKSFVIPLPQKSTAF